MGQDRVSARSRPFWRALGQQLRCPSGIRGRAISSILDIVNAGPHRAALAALKAEANSAILEIGYGSGRATAQLLREHTEMIYCGIDQSPDMFRLASRRNADAVRDRRAQLVCGCADRLPWDDGAFDRVLAMNVAYFFDKDGRDVREINRVLRPGGRVVLYVTERETMQNWPFVTPATHATFDASSLNQMLRSGGFDETEISIEDVSLPFGGSGLLGICGKSTCSQLEPLTLPSDRTSL